MLLVLYCDLHIILYNIVQHNDVKFSSQKVGFLDSFTGPVLIL